MPERIIMYCGYCGNQTGFEIRGFCSLDKSVEEEAGDSHTEQLFDDITEWRLLQCITCSLIIRVMEKQFVEFPEPEQHRGLRASPTHGESALGRP